MKTHSKGHFIIRGILFGIAGAALFTTILMLLWNWLMPMIFGLTTIGFWEALGILLLSKILFGGGHPGSHHFHSYNRDKYFKERFHKKFEYARAHFGKPENEAKTAEE